jgi:hypothetical protein
VSIRFTYLTAQTVRITIAKAFGSLTIQLPLVCQTVEGEGFKIEAAVQKLDFPMQSLFFRCFLVTAAASGRSPANSARELTALLFQTHSSDDGYRRFAPIGGVVSISVISGAVHKHFNILINDNKKRMKI